MEDRAFATDLTVPQLIARLFDEKADPMERRRDAYRLARANTPEAVAALKSYFQTASVMTRRQLRSCWARGGARSTRTGCGRCWTIRRAGGHRRHSGLKRYRR